MKVKLFSSLLGLVLFFSLTSSAFAATIYWPTSSRNVTSEFGMRWHPITQEYQMHYGMDIGALTAGVEGDPIKAMHNGVVKTAGWNSQGFGNVIFINHYGANQMKLSNVQSVYAHLKTISVQAGNAVTGGQKIGTMGTTGSSTAAHLHLETRTCPDSTCSQQTYQTQHAHNPRYYYSNNEALKLNESLKLYAPSNVENLESSESLDELSPGGPYFYPLEELEKMTPEELIEIGYPNPYEFQ